MVIDSPCILVCSIDEASGFCIGCGRTRNEIASWIRYTPEERQSVMVKLALRIETLQHSLDARERSRS
jgi:predicted Fe-S protein YdhL (DUF1289 family)